MFIDATVGGGGHTYDLLKRGARVLAIDRDPQALEYLNKEIRNWKVEIGNLRLVQGNFANIAVAKDCPCFSPSNKLPDTRSPKGRIYVKSKYNGLPYWSSVGKRT